MATIRDFNYTSPLEELPEKKSGEETHLTLYHGKATDTMASMNSKDDSINPITGNATIERGELKVIINKFETLPNTLGVNTHKLFAVGLANFTALNNYSKKEHEKINTTVTFSLAEYALWLGLDVEEHPTSTEEEAHKEKERVKKVLNEAQKRVKGELQTLLATSLTWEEKIKGKPKDYEAINLLQRVSVKKGVITMQFSEPIAEYLVLLPLTKYPKTQLRISGRSQNAYALGNKFAVHHNMDSNIKNNRENILKVESLLQVTNLPSYEAVTSARNSWIDRIKEPFENALEEVVRAGTLKDWSYTHGKGAILTEEEAYNITDYKTFTQLYIVFSMGEEVDHAPRMERQQEKIAKKRGKG